MRVYPPVHPIPRSHEILGHSTGCPPVPLTDACVSHCPSHPTIPWDIPWDVHLSLSQMCIYPLVHSISRSHGILGPSTGCPPVPLTDACVFSCLSHPILRSHGIMGHSMRCLPVPLTEARVSHCPSHPTIPWDHRTFHGMSTCPSHRCTCILLSILSHDPMGSWDIPRDVNLSLSQMHVCPTVHPIPLSHGTFHGMSTCLSHRCACILLSIPSHDPMGSWDIPWDVHLSLSQKHCPSHPTIPWDHRTFHGMSTCPSHRCMCVPLSIPSHDPMGPRDIPWDVHLSLS